MSIDIFIYKNKEKIINSLIKRNYSNINIIYEIFFFKLKRKYINNSINFLRFKNKKNRIKLLKYKIKYLNLYISFLINKIPNILFDDVNFFNNGINNDKIIFISDKRNLSFINNNLLPHWELGKIYNLFDTDKTINITGSGFITFLNIGAKLCNAIINLLLDYNSMYGYNEYKLPYIVNTSSVYGSGHYPDKKNQMYSIYLNNKISYLIPTSEVTLINFYKNNIFLNSELPIKMTAYSPCFRREAGSYGKDVRCLNRLHQFDKVEILEIVSKESSNIRFNSIIKHIIKLIKYLELPYRVLKLCSKNTGFSSSITYDIEIYSMGQRKWLEVSSISNCKDFQTKKLNIKYKINNFSKKYCYSLNASSLAIPRLLSAILENNQYNNYIKIPKVIQKYFKFDVITKNNI